MRRNPDELSALAKYFSVRSMPASAHTATCLHIKSKAHWLLVNGKWVSRKGIMRTTPLDVAT